MTISDITRLEEQIDDLQSRLAYQEDTIQALNTVVSQQDSELLQLKQHIQYLQERLESFLNAKTVEAHQKPPHY